jgi:hypothetical protein
LERTIPAERSRALVIGSIGPDAPLHHSYITAGYTQGNFG